MDGGSAGRQGANERSGRWVPAPSLVLACLALLASMGGFAFAGPLSKGGQVPNDSIKSRHIADNEVRNPDLAPNSVGTDELAGPVYSYGAVGTSQILNQSVVDQHFANSSVGTGDVTDHSLTEDDFDLGGIYPRKAYYDLGDDSTDLGNAYKTVAEVELPKGRYLVFARVHLNVSLDDWAAVGCIVIPSATTQAQNISETNPVAFADTVLRELRDEPIAMTGVYETEHTLDLRLRCSRGGNEAWASDPQLVALRLESVK